MSYQVKRVNPFWHTNPAIAVVVVVGAVLGLLGYQKDIKALSIVGGAAAGLAVVFAAKPAVSAVLGTLGVFGGLVTFVLVPNLQMAGLSMVYRLLSTVLFAVFYMVLMDALVLVVAVLYNLFAGTIGLGAVQLELETTAEESGE